jgi:hypothetical protein
MVKSSVSTWNDVIEQGATFYRVVSLFSDAEQTIPIDLTSKVPRSTLMTETGKYVADFGCSVLVPATAGQLAWTMPRSGTAAISSANTYIYNIDLDEVEGDATDRVQKGLITVNPGQGHP